MFFVFLVSPAGQTPAIPSDAWGVRRLFRSEAGAVLLWVVASVVLGAVVVPWLYQGGRQFSAMVAADGEEGVIGWLGAACGRAQFGRFYNRSLLLCALLLVPALLRRIGYLRREREAAGVVLPIRPSWPLAQRWLLWAVGAVLAGGLVWLLGIVMEWMGAFSGTGTSLQLKQLLAKAVLPAAVVSILEEAMFRGLLLGLWLRVARPISACVGSSLVFAAMHFLSPPPGYVIADPTSVMAGFELLGATLLHYTDPRFFVADFLTLVGVGLVLAGARVRTGSLWLPMGLHFGWVMAFKMFHLTHVRLPDGPVDSLLVGDSLRSGLLPLAMLGLTAACCHLLLCCSRGPACARDVMENE